MSELRKHGADVIERVLRGEPLTVTRNGAPVAALRPLQRRPVPLELLRARWPSRDRPARTPGRPRRAPRPGALKAVSRTRTADRRPTRLRSRVLRGLPCPTGSFRWPARLRVSRPQSAPGIWEMTWNFSGPDGRATFEFVMIDGEQYVRWRSIGDHGIYRQP